MMKQNGVALITGMIFGLGLCISKMVDPKVVIGFLDIFRASGKWDPRLLFVMAGALLVAVTTYPLILKRGKPVCTDSFKVPQSKIIDKPLILGAVLFGIGWGLGGICPGPAISALAFGLVPSYVFVVAMLVGMYVYEKKTRS